MLRRGTQLFKIFFNKPQVSVLYSRFHMGYELNARPYEEVKITVPWGHIAGKWWGPKDKRPILGIHGWQDNCGTFDTLVNHLPLYTPFLAIDLPGHGLSSKIPPGLFYNGFDLVILLRRIVNYYQWKRISLIGHSLGGITSYLYASTFPESVEFVIAFDTITPMTDIGHTVHCQSENIDKFLIFDSLNSNGKEPPSYPYEKLDEILHEGSGRSVALESCKCLLVRNIQQSKNDKNKYYFTRDTRVKLQFFMNWYYDKLMKDGYKLICPVLEIQASNSSFSLEHTKTSLHHDIMDVIRSSSKDFQKHEIEGTHHLHLNNPEKAANLINTFIEKYYAGDK